MNSWRFDINKEKAYAVAKTAANLGILLGGAAVCAYAQAATVGLSPVGKVMNTIMNEATGTWAWAGTGTAAVLTGLGAAFGSHGIQEKATKLFVGSAAAIGAQSLISVFH